MDRDIFWNSYSNVARKVLSPVERWFYYGNIKKIDPGNIDILKPVDNVPSLILPPHWSYFDPFTIHLAFLNNGLQPPLCASGKNLIIFAPILGPFGCYFIEREPPRRKDIYRTADFLEEGYSIMIFDVYDTFEDGKRKGGRSWEGRHQEFSGFASLAAGMALEHGVDVKLIRVGINYDPYIPEEKIFESRYKHKDKKLNDTVLRVVDWSALFPIVPHGIINPDVHLKFDKPIYFTELVSKFSDKEYTSLSTAEQAPIIKQISKDNTQETKKLFMPGSWDFLYAALEPKNGGEYEISEAKEKMLELRQTLDDNKYDTSLINGDINDILTKLEETKRIEIINNKVRVIPTSLSSYHENRIRDLLYCKIH